MITVEYTDMFHTSDGKCIIAVTPKEGFNPSDLVGKHIHVPVLVVAAATDRCGSFNSIPVEERTVYLHITGDKK